MNLIIAGDVVTNESNKELFKQKNLTEVLGQDLLRIWENSDYKVFNLEAPITNSNNTIKKCGPNLKNNPDIIEGIKQMNPSCIMLANNHIMDYGKEGYKETIDFLNQNNINWIGVGENVDNLKKYYIINNNIGIYNVCETEFSNATEDIPGANYYNEFNIEKDLMEIKSKCDYLIVIYHGGKEYYRYPSPLLQKRCRYLIDCGANLVTCQHSHCIGCKEEYNGGTIVYGQGNFIFNKKSDEYWDTSLLIDLNLDNYSISYLPIIRTEHGTKLAVADDANNIMRNFEERSDIIKNDDFIIKNYRELSKDNIYKYLLSLHGNNMFYKILNKIFKGRFLKVFYNKNNLLSILNYMECEAHRELLTEGLKSIIYMDKDDENE